MPRARLYALVALGGLILVPALVVLAYLVDDGGRGDQVASNVSLVGTRIGGLKGRALESRIDTVATRLEHGRLDVRAPKGGFTAAASDIKFTVDRAATARAAARVGRSGNVLSRSWEWLRGFVRARNAPLHTHASGDATYALVASKDRGPHKPAVEPTLKLEKGEFVVVRGKNGSGIDPAEILRELDDAAQNGSPIVVRVNRGTVHPRLTYDEARTLARDANRLSTEPLPVSAGTARAKVPTSTLRSWILPVMSDAGPRLTVDSHKTLSDLADLLPNAGKSPTETRFTVVGGNVQILDGSDGTGCCDSSAVDLVNRALRERGTQTVDLPLKVLHPRLTGDEARKLGIVEKVATFTTQHPAGQPRVHNIHLMADMVRGSIIQPGDSFSINGTVGQRTLAKGFVVDHVIGEDSVFAEDVGGGVSQFATTLFNAAFFAGLQLQKYQSHSLYISRYPYGREATMGWPEPDLVIGNPSPYGILIWPSYNDTSLTVDLYSTKWVNAIQSGQSETPYGKACKRVKTERTRTFLSDGHTSVDSVFAIYHPSEGVSCDGTTSSRLTTTTSTPPKAKPTTTTSPPGGPATTTATTASSG